MLLDAPDSETLELVVAALHSEAAKRQRAATRAAGDLATEAAQKKSQGEAYDRRPGSVRIAKVLEEAYALDAFANDLKRAWHAAETTRESTEEVIINETPETTPGVEPLPPSVAEPDDDLITDPAEVPGG